MGTTDGSLIDGDIALLSTAATSAKRPRAPMGGVEESFGRLAKLERPDEDGIAEVVSLLRSEGKPAAVGFRRAGALGSVTWLLEPRAMKSPGGGWPTIAKKLTVNPLCIKTKCFHTTVTFLDIYIPEGFAALGRLRAVGFGRFILTLHRSLRSVCW